MSGRVKGSSGYRGLSSLRLRGMSLLGAPDNPTHVRVVRTVIYVGETALGTWFDLPVGVTEVEVDAALGGD